MKRSAKLIITIMALLSPYTAFADNPVSDKAKDYSEWMSNKDTKAIRLRISNQIFWAKIQAKDIIQDSDNGIYFTENGKKRYYNGPYLLEEE